MAVNFLLGKLHKIIQDFRLQQTGSKMCSFLYLVYSILLFADLFYLVGFEIKTIICQTGVNNTLTVY